MGKKIRKAIDSKVQIRLCFHEKKKKKKNEKITKNFFVVSVHRKGFLLL